MYIFILRDEIEKEELEGAPQNSGEGETPDGNRKIIYFLYHNFSQF